MDSRLTRVMGMTGIAVVAIVLMSGCTVGQVDALPSASVPETAATSSAPASDPEEGEAGEEPRQGAADGFLAWFEATREPDVETACAGLTPELAARMIAEMNADGAIHVETCEELISATAELYRALDQSDQIDISVQQETETDATLFVSYPATGDCGTVVMTRAATDWIITEQSQECPE